ncbi:hypothetical protein KR067_009956 [Drosophila pandora]|nr:hypothetical protein KR067_009956 [Drosophila pandora]
MMFRYNSHNGRNNFPQILGTEPKDIADRLNTIYGNLNAPSSKQVTTLWRQPRFASPPITELEMEERRKRDCNSQLRTQHGALCDEVPKASYNFPESYKDINNQEMEKNQD